VKANWFRRFILPGLIFQSVVIAGGYGTGREIAEFFMSLGPRSGLAAMAVSTVIWSVVCAVSFEFARSTGSEDYRTFFRHLLGRWGEIYEICWFIFMILVLAVIAAAAGSILLETFGVPYVVGVVGMIVLIGYLVFLGTEAIEKFFSAWSFVLYGVYLVLFAWAFAAFGGDIGARFSDTPAQSGWMVQGVAYAGYNLAIIPAILFCIRHVTTRGEAVGAGLLAGPIAMLPAFFFFVAMAGLYPDVADATVPANSVLEALGSRAFQVAFQIVLFGTLVETGTGMIHAVNERIAHRMSERGRTLTKPMRGGIAVSWLVLGALVAQFGLIALIARGYGTLTWVFIAIYVAPVLTLGVWRIARGASVDLPASP
jgi:uncharacterized membrane protein YkvI